MARQETIQLKATPGTAPSELVLSLPTAGRSYKNITEAITDLPEISSSIEKKTGWAINHELLSFRVVSTQELASRSMEDITRRTGIPTTPPHLTLGRPVARMVLHAYHRNVIATYLPSEKAIIINEERLRGMSQDAVKSTLHHELTHAAQHQRFPEFMAKLDVLAREQRLLDKHGGDLPTDERERRLSLLTSKVQARMCLIEGQATALQKMYEREAGLHPEVKMGPIEVALSLTSMLIPGGTAKVRQYIQGQALFEKIHALGSREVDSLFKDPGYTDLVFSGDRRQ